MQREEVNIDMEHSNLNSETGLKSEVKTIYISKAKLKSEQGDKLFSSLKMITDMEIEQSTRCRVPHWL